LIKYSDVVGLPVICIENGKKIGLVSEIIFCPKFKEVRAIVLDRKGCQIRKKALLLEDVVNIGSDAVVVNDCSCTKTLRELETSNKLREKGNLIGLRIYSKSGKDLGTVKDVLFDFSTRSVEGLEVSDSLLQDIMQGRNILPLFGNVEFGEDNVLVDREAVEEMQSTGGGIKKILLSDKGHSPNADEKR